MSKTLRAKMDARVLISLLFFSATMGCAQLRLSQDDPGFREISERSYELSLEQCRKGVISAFNDLGGGLEEQSADGTKLTSKRSNLESSAVATTPSGGSAEVSANIQKITSDAKYYVIIQQSGGRCKVRLNSMRIWENGAEWKKAGKFYVADRVEQFFAAFEAAANASKF